MSFLFDINVFGKSLGKRKLDSGLFCAEFACFSHVFFPRRYSGCWCWSVTVYFLFVQVGEFKAHAAEWKANVRAEFRETRRRLSVEIHDKLQRAATIRSMERRQLGLEQRAHSLDMLSPEKRALFASLDTGRFKTSSQESIDTKLNNLRLKGACEPYGHQGGEQAPETASSSEENLFNMRFGSLTKLGRRNKNRELRRNIAEDARRASVSINIGNGMLGEERTEEEEDGEPDEESGERKEGNISLRNLSQYAKERSKLNGFVPAEAKNDEDD